MRLGRNKALETINSTSLLEQAISQLSFLNSSIVIVTAENQSFPGLTVHSRLRMVTDTYPGKGPLVGIYTGLTASDSFFNLVVACDMPFLNTDLLRYMLSLTPGYDVVIPHLPEGLEPLHAIYNHRCRSPMGRLLAQGHRKIIAFFPEARVRYVTEEEIDLFDPQRRSFINVNTPQDWERVQRMLATEG